MTIQNQQTILVIDDCCDNLLLMQLLLESEGYQVHCATNGTEGLKQVKNLNPDLIIVDLMMSDMSGKEVIDKLKNQDFSASIPTVLLTANAGITKKEVPDADLIYFKPFSLSDFLSQMRFLLPLPSEPSTSCHSDRFALELVSVFNKSDR